MSNKIKRAFGRKRPHSAAKKWPKAFNADENTRPLFVTMTGEPLQLARIHYDIIDRAEIERAFAALKCMDFDPSQPRWVWNYHAEAQKLKFDTSYDGIPRKHRPIVIGSFYFPTAQRMYLDVNSFDRAIAAIPFFDKHLSRKCAFLSHIQIVNKLFQAVPGIIPRQNDFFDPLSPERPDKISSFEEIAADKTHTQAEKLALAQREMDENLKKPIEEIESLRINFYEDGIESLKGALKMRGIIAFEHWQGNVTFSFFDIFKKIIPGM